MDGTDGEGERWARPSDLIHAGEICELLGVHPSRAYTITRLVGFPPHWYRGSKERIWLRADVLPWIEERNRRLGRRPKT